MVRGDQLNVEMLLEAIRMAKGSVKAAGDIIKGLRLSAFNKGLVKSRLDLREAIDAALLQVMLSADRDYLTIKMNLPKRSEEHTSELQSLMRISYAVLCLKKKTNT